MRLHLTILTLLLFSLGCSPTDVAKNPDPSNSKKISELKSKLRKPPISKKSRKTDQTRNQPVSSDAQAVLQTALQQAGSENKKVLLHYGAPS